MKEKIINIIYEISGNDDFLENNQMDILDEVIDSLGFMELVSRIEEEFDIELELSQIESNVWRNVDKIVEMLEKYV